MDILAVALALAFFALMYLFADGLGKV